jgi:hypothetical protein
VIEDETDRKGNVVIGAETPTHTKNKTLTEDILGEFGFRVVWSWTPTWADVKVYAIESRGVDAASTPLFRRNGCTGSGDVVLDIADAEVYMEGFLKWDGCAELDQGCHHWCEEQDFIKHCMLLRYLWQRAHQLLEASDFRDKNKAQN